MLYGIRKIEYCNAANLAFSDIFSQYVDTCTPTNEFTELCIVQQKATLKVESDIENKQVIYRTELQFDTIAESGLERGNLAFKVTTVNGEQFLIGCPSRPRVVVTTAHNVAESANGQSGYTTICKFTALYKPKTIPNTAEPISDLRQFEICCGQIQQPAAPDTREFDICCGQIKTSETISGPAYDVCCGEIIGSGPEPTLLTVMWLNYDLSVVDSKTYYEGQPEPTTTAEPVRPSTSTTAYTFSGWELYGQTETSKVYMAQYNETPIYHDLKCDIVATGSVAEENRYLIDSALNGQQYSGDGEQPLVIIENDEAVYHGDAVAFRQNANFQIVSTDWHDYFTRFTDRTPIYDANNQSLIIGYKLNSYSGPLPPWS